MPPPAECDAVVVGGGIAGTSVAYFLASRGLDVTLLDRRQVASGQSGQNAGWIRSLGRVPAELPLSLAARTLWGQLSTELSLPMVPGGGYALAYSDDEMARLSRWLVRSQAYIAGVRKLTPEMVEAELPFLRRRPLGAIHHPLDAHCDPVAATRALAAAAAGRGVKVREQVSVGAILTRRGLVRGVSTSRGDVLSRVVVCCAGARSSRLLRPLGVHLPVQVLRSTLVRSLPMPHLTDATVMTSSGSLRQDGEGRLVIATGVRADLDATLESVRYFRFFASSLPRARGRLSVHPLFFGRELRAAITPRRHHDTAGPWPEVARPNLRSVGRAAKAVGELLGAELQLASGDAWAGYVDLTPDGLPVIDRPAGLEGLFVVTGLSGHGFGTGPAAGLLASQLITGEDPIVDPSVFRLDRLALPPSPTALEDALI